LQALKQSVPVEREREAARIDQKNKQFLAGTPFQLNMEVVKRGFPAEVGVLTDAKESMGLVSFPQGRGEEWVALGGLEVDPASSAAASKIQAIRRGQVTRRETAQQVRCRPGSPPLPVSAGARAQLRVRVKIMGLIITRTD
jgi:hypothetical protein